MRVQPMASSEARGKDRDKGPPIAPSEARSLERDTFDSKRYKDLEEFSVKPNVNLITILRGYKTIKLLTTVINLIQSGLKTST